MKFKLFLFVSAILLSNTLMATVEYKLQIAEVEVTDANAANIFAGVDGMDGKVSFSIDGEHGTLILNNATINGGIWYHPTYSDNTKFTIRVIGKCAICYNGPACGAIYSQVAQTNIISLDGDNGELVIDYNCDPYTGSAIRAYNARGHCYLNITGVCLTATNETPSNYSDCNYAIECYSLNIGANTLLDIKAPDYAEAYSKYKTTLNVATDCEVAYLLEGKSGIVDGNHIIIAPKNETNILDGVLFVGNVLAKAITENISGSYVINEGTSVVEIFAFWNCSSLSSIIVPSSVTSIRKCAFKDCTGLTSITCMGSTPATLGRNAFDNTNNCPIYVPCGTLEVYKLAWPDYASRIQYAPLAYTVEGKVNDTQMGNVTVPVWATCDTIVTATPNSGYHFVKWSDGITDNPRPLKLTRDTIFEAIFAHNPVITYVFNPIMGSVIGDTITPTGMSEADISFTANTNYGYHFVQWNDGVTTTTHSIHLTKDTVIEATFAPNKYAVNVTCNSAQGSISGEIGSQDYLSQPTFEAVPNYGYHFVQWSDNDTQNPRSITVLHDTTFVAYFILNTYSIFDGSNSTQGYINGIGSFNYLTQRELTAVPNYGYHFVRWSDGNTDNPHTIILTQDTTMTAIFNRNPFITYNYDANLGYVEGPETTPVNVKADFITFTANPLENCHFVKWLDGNAENPRTIYLDQDTSMVAFFARNPVITYNYDASMGFVEGVQTTPTGVAADYITMKANPFENCHFVKWLDGNTENPRTIYLDKDTTFTAEFAKNTYTISTTSANPEWGTIAGDTSALYLDEVEISAIPNYGYHFVQWNDNNTSNPRSFILTQDTTFTATFAKNVYTITKNAVHGSISGYSSAEYLDFVTLTVIPDYGYHFTQWSDGVKDNPRIFQITKDTTFTAEFAPDRVGTCGKDLALVWSYDPTNKVLTIGNAGSFTENMRFGVEAPNEMEELVIGNNVTAIGENAFAGLRTLKKVSVGESVKTIHDRAFYNCENLETIFNYRQTPANAYSTAFDGVDKFECKLYVLSGSIDMYKNASVWRDFYYKYAIGAEETTVTTNDVQVEPQDNAATITWPTNDNAATYTIEITKDGVLFCTLIFNANGQLTGIAFAPSRNGSHHAPAAVLTANGLQFTVTGLNCNTQYGYSVIAKNSSDEAIATYFGEFTTTNIVTAVDQVTNDQSQTANKIIKDGHIFILRGEKVYTVTGQEVK